MNEHMNEGLNELRESARKVVQDAGIPATEETIWPLFGELGWLLTTVPESMDGLGLGIQGACALHAELGRGLAQAPFLPALMAIEALCESELVDKVSWLERFTAGDCVTAPLAEPEFKLQHAGTAQATVSGLASGVQSADRASHALVWTDSADCVALVSLTQAGVELTERPTWDTTRRLFDLRLTELKLDEQRVLARGAAAAELIGRIQALRDFGLAADSVAAASALLDMTVEHLQTRSQFRRPLAMFQALKHRCADLKAPLAAADALLQHSLSACGENIASDQAQLQGKKAKYLACSVFARVAEESLQLHGGIGMAAEHPCHLFLKRAMLNEHLGTRGGGYEEDIAANFLAQT